MDEQEIIEAFECTLHNEIKPFLKIFHSPDYSVREVGTTLKKPYSLKEIIKGLSNVAKDRDQSWGRDSFRTSDVDDILRFIGYSSLRDIVKKFTEGKEHEEIDFFSIAELLRDCELYRLDDIRYEIECLDPLEKDDIRAIIYYDRIDELATIYGEYYWEDFIRVAKKAECDLDDVIDQLRDWQVEPEEVFQEMESMYGIERIIRPLTDAYGEETVFSLIKEHCHCEKRDIEEILADYDYDPVILDKVFQDEVEDKEGDDALFCPLCNTKVSEEDKRCPNCGAEFCEDGNDDVEEEEENKEENPITDDFDSAIDELIEDWK